MIKKLTAKTQELNPKLPQYSNSFSKCVIIKPETQELLLKKGTVYSVFDVSGESNFDTELVIKVINDVINNLYFQSESISPIQSMEKAIVETKEKVLQLSNDTLTSNPQSINLNMITAVLWGSVLYIIKFGGAKGYLMKNGEISPLEMISEGNFSTASKVVDEDEVLILATEHFERSFPPERLLATSIGEGDLDPNQACLLMRLIIDTTFSDNEVVDFGLGDAVSKNKNRVRVEKLTSIIEDASRWILKSIKKVCGVFVALGKLLADAISKVLPRRKAVLLTRSISQLSGKGGTKTKSWLPLSLMSISLAFLVFFILRSTVLKSTNKENMERKNTGQQTVETSTKEVVNTETEDKSKDEQYKIKRVSPEVFYDLKITDQSVEPSEIEIVGDKVVIVDKITGKIYVSDISTPNFKLGVNTFPGIKSLASSEDLLSFNDNEGYKTYSIKNSTVISSYKVEGLSLTFPYAGFIYSVSSDILSKNTEKDGKLDGVVWAQSPDFVDAKSMSIAYSIYILKKDGNLVNYSGGSKTSFAINGLEKPLSDPSKVSTNIDFEYIYIADKGNEAIVVIDNKGNVVKQYKYEDSSTWSDIKSIAISSDEKTIFVLNSSKIYKLNIEN
ncbi:hypothetical protein GYA37_02665 [candidate division WWE3 bacterium]|uniref:PPM-type phosphatase domain-containing protein n=1 Tax=candidate division WWE3 bacterium TaxID=2053526 RepID=A0A7X9E736_UNCKA|nr:hypothetical protein [candidate division WWE3 bacterium]